MRKKVFQFFWSRKNSYQCKIRKYWGNHRGRWFAWWRGKCSANFFRWTGTADGNLRARAPWHIGSLETWMRGRKRWIYRFHGWWSLSSSWWFHTALWQVSFGRAWSGNWITLFGVELGNGRKVDIRSKNMVAARSMLKILLNRSVAWFVELPGYMG